MRVALLIAVLLFAFSPAATSQVYRWVDAHGVAHYADSPPPPSAKLPSRIVSFKSQTPTQIIQMRVEQKGTQSLAWADNRIAGPVQIELSFANVNNIVADPPLPVRAVLSANGSQLLSRFDLATERPEGSFKLNITAVPGDPNAKPENVIYRLPLDTRDWRIDQSWGGHFSHNDPENYYAVDFNVKIGTPILASRDGVVMQVESNFDGAGLNREKYSARANLVRILHEDGSMAIYAHLRADGVWVQQGQHVHAGQKIGLSGNTGYTSGPHLHFAVEVNRGMRVESIPIRIRAPDGSMVTIPQG